MALYLIEEVRDSSIRRRRADQLALRLGKRLCLLSGPASLRRLDVVPFH